MTTTTTRETRRDRLALAREAGFGRFSFVAVLAGVLVAFGAFAIVAAIAGAIAEAVNADTNFSEYDFDTVSLVSGLVLAAVLFLAWFFGGYVAGRMARRSGMVNGVAVFLLGLVIAAVVGGVTAALTDTDNVQDNLRNVGLPTSADDWANMGATIGGIVALVLMLAGSILGALKGERWHGKLLDRALDPQYGPEAERRRAAERDIERADHDWQREEQRMTRRDETRQMAVGGTMPGAAPVAPAAHDEHTMPGAAPVAPAAHDEGAIGRQQAEQQLAAERAARADDQIDLREHPVEGATSAQQHPTDQRR